MMAAPSYHEVTSEYRSWSSQIPNKVPSQRTSRDVASTLPHCTQKHMGDLHQSSSSEPVSSRSLHTTLFRLLRNTQTSLIQLHTQSLRLHFLQQRTLDRSHSGYPQKTSIPLLLAPHHSLQLLSQRHNLPPLHRPQRINLRLRHAHQSPNHLWRQIRHRHRRGSLLLLLRRRCLLLRWGWLILIHADWWCRYWLLVLELWWVAWILMLLVLLLGWHRRLY